MKHYTLKTCKYVNISELTLKHKDWKNTSTCVWQVQTKDQIDLPVDTKCSSQREWPKGRCFYLLQHNCLLLLQKGLELRRRQDLLHLLWGNHLRRHHGHRYRDLQRERVHSISITMSIKSLATWHLPFRKCPHEKSGTSSYDFGTEPKVWETGKEDLTLGWVCLSCVFCHMGKVICCAQMT